MPVKENGIWEQDVADATHQSSANLAKFLINYLPSDKPVYDFGCGNGYYVGELEKKGFKATGIEGFKLDNFKCSNVFIHDLTQPIKQFVPKGSVISLEVGEHLPKSAQETFMRTLTENCDKHLVMSWAEIGQPGIGHINCRDLKEVISDVESRGFIYKKDLTLRTRLTIEDNTSWFQRTLLIFERK